MERTQKVSEVGKKRIREMIEVNHEHKEEIYDLLIQLKKLSEAFNQMIGSLYSGICADEMNEILDELKKMDVKVTYYQYIPGRVRFTNLDKLIEKYNEEKNL